LDSIYRRQDEIASIAGELEGELSESDFDITELASGSDSSDAPVVRLLQSIFEDAIQVKASDIHIEPEESQLRIRMRIDGDLQEQVMKEHRIASALVSRLKIMSGLDCLKTVALIFG
jgi:MSHA biogenesis protein MshE